MRAGPMGTFASELTYSCGLCSKAHRPREAIVSTCVCLGLHEAHTPPTLNLPSACDIARTAGSRGSVVHDGEAVRRSAC